jgi:hypothetical protein
LTGDVDPAEEDEDDENSDDDKDQHKAAKKKADVADEAHCDINFVKNTPYKLLEGSSDTVWAEAVFADPQPPVPTSRSIQTTTGDYVLIAGDDVVLQKNARGKTVQVSFAPEDEFVLTTDWVQFDGEMTGQDLKDLCEEGFLLWWQNVKPPPVPKARIPRKGAGKNTKKKG